MDHLDCTYLIKCVDKRKEDLFRFDMQDYMITKKIMWHVFLLFFTYFFVFFGKKLFYEYQSTTILMPCAENMRLPGPILKKEQGDFSVSLFWSKKRTHSLWETFSWRSTEPLEKSFFLPYRLQIVLQLDLWGLSHVT